MNDSKYTVEAASEVIHRNGGLIKDKTIIHKAPGLKVLGAIDFLVNHNKFIWLKGDK